MESMPLPLAGVILTESIHRSVLELNNIDAGIVLFKNAPQDFYISSSIGLSGDKWVFDAIIEFCNEVSVIFQSDTDNFPYQVFPSLKDNLDDWLKKQGFRQGRIFRIHDYLNNSGFWILFYKNDLSMTKQGSIAVTYNSTTPDIMNILKEAVNEQAELADIDEIISSWVKILDFRDKETEEHTHRVAGLAAWLARIYGLNPEEITSIRRGAFLHDIGKIVIPNSILKKAGELTEEEWKIMRLHPTLAKELLANFSFPQEVLDIPCYHHENWDGSGYPHGLKNTQIPLSARLFKVVDAWDALNSDRPYRDKWDWDKIANYFKSNSGIEFDPEIVQVFLKMVV